MSRPKLYSSATKYHLGYHPVCRWLTTVEQDLPGLKLSEIVSHSSEPGVKMIITLRYYEIFYTGIINRGRLPVTIGITAGNTDIGSMLFLE